MSYFDGQLSRQRVLRNHDSWNGACRSYQRYKHGLGEGAKTNFVLDTTGRYSECNLLDADHVAENPGGVQPSYCRGCRYEYFEECNMCGSEDYPDECNYSYAWAQLLTTAPYNGLKGAASISEYKLRKECIGGNQVV